MLGPLLRMPGSLLRRSIIGRDWATKIGNRDVRMKTEHVKTQETAEEVSSQGLKKRLERRNRSEALLLPEKTVGGLEKRLKKGIANL